MTPIVPPGVAQLLRRLREEGTLSEGQITQALGVDRLTCREILDEAETDPRREFARHHLGEPYRGNFFPNVPLLTDKQDSEARAGTCPSCHIESLVDVGTGEGLRFLGCVSCTAVVVLASRPGDRPLMRITGRMFGRTHLAQQVKLAMTMYEQRGGRPTGYCTEGDHCVCGGDLPAIQARCGNWREL
jgi:hypothetical protein